MTPPSDAVIEINARGGPVVFVDTCSILDLTRGPRENFHPNHAQAAMELIQLAWIKKVTIALPEQVLLEFRDNYEEVKQNATDSLKKLNIQMSNLYGNLRAYGHPVSQFSGIPETWFAAACDEISEQFKAAAVSFDMTADAKRKAVDRTLSGRAPSGSKKQSFKDCLIIESCFETLAVARGLGFTASAHFLSSNTKEYSPDNKGLHTDLVSEFASLRLDYASTYAQLRNNPSIKDL